MARISAEQQGPAMTFRYRLWLVFDSYGSWLASLEVVVASSFMLALRAPQRVNMKMDIMVASGVTKDIGKDQ